jgi:hypothetical protein
MEVNPQNVLANVTQNDEDIPPPPRLTRQNAEVSHNVTVNGKEYPVQYTLDGLEYITINDEIYNLFADANGRYIMMNDVQTPIGGRRSRRSKSRKSKRSRRSRRV